MSALLNLTKKPGPASTADDGTRVGETTAAGCLRNGETAGGGAGEAGDPNKGAAPPGTGPPARAKVRAEPAVRASTGTGTLRSGTPGPGAPAGMADRGIGGDGGVAVGNAGGTGDRRDRHRGDVVVGTAGRDPGGAGGSGTTDPALSAPGAAETDGAVISVGSTGGGSSATPRFAANSAAAQKIQPMRFIRFLPVPWSSFIAFPA